MATTIHRTLSLLLIATACTLGSAHGTQNPPSDWRHLSPQQQELLTPLAQEWDQLNAVSQRKWQGIAERYPGMTPQEQTTLRSRVAEWAKLTPAEREVARTRYRRLSAAPGGIDARTQAQWQQYNALSAAERQRLKKAVASGRTPRGASSVREARRSTEQFTVQSLPRPNQLLEQANTPKRPEEPPASP